MTQGIKVEGHPDLQRSRACPGLILNSNTEAYQATVNARERVSGLENQVAELMQMVKSLTGGATG